MSLGLILIPLVVVVATLVLVTNRLLRRKSGPVQYSLRTLMIGVTLVALVLSSISTWRYLSLARIEWLAPSSPAARQLWTEPVVIRQGDDFTATYRAKRRYVVGLPTRGGSCVTGMDGQRQEITLGSSDESHIEETLAALAEADTLREWWFVIRGVVEDRKGQPVGDATVDLMIGSHAYIPVATESYIHVYDDQTREDGTFIMLTKAPPGRGYSLRIRYGGNRRMNTAPFTLSDDNRELVARIHVW